MVEKKVIICDCCETNIAVAKCDSCNGDLCKRCAKTIKPIVESSSISPDLINLRLMTTKNEANIKICSKCVSKCRSMFKDLEKMKPEEQGIFMKDLMAFINYRLPQITTASKI
jgi:uncharacterized paraquat-inducible protein A